MITDSPVMKTALLLVLLCLYSGAPILGCAGVVAAISRYVDVFSYSMLLAKASTEPVQSPER